MDGFLLREGVVIFVGPLPLGLCLLVPFVYVLYTLVYSIRLIFIKFTYLLTKKRGKYEKQQDEDGEG